MDPIIDPVDKALIAQELTPELFLRHTNKGSNEIYVFSASQAPNAMRELGRIREECFRAGGGGTGKSCDIDEYDTMENGYKQLVVWDPRNQVIVGGYRYILGNDVLKNAQGTQSMATSHMFTYSPKFEKEYLPYTIELGRSFVTGEFQSSKAGGLSIFALDNLWDGLGALIVEHSHIRYFFGKVTMYSSYNVYARNLILKFMEMYFSDPEKLVTPVHPLPINISDEEIAKVFVHHEVSADFRALKKTVRKHGVNIPPLFNAYISLSPQLKMLGTAVNEEFGGVEETGILIAIDHILDDKKQRHIETYQKQK